MTIQPRTQRTSEQGYAVELSIILETSNPIHQKMTKRQPRTQYALQEQVMQNWTGSTILIDCRVDSLSKSKSQKPDLQFSNRTTHDVSTEPNQSSNKHIRRGSTTTNPFWHKQKIDVKKREPRTHATGTHFRAKLCIWIKQHPLRQQTRYTKKWQNYTTTAFRVS